MKNFDGILFDIDGTLTSTNELIFASFNHVAKKYLNKTYTPEELIAMFGPPEDEILRELTGEKYNEAHFDYFDFYHKNHEALADIYPGIRDVLEDIKKARIPLGIFTGKGRKASTITLKTLGIFDYFDMIVTGDDVKRHKPNPEGVLNFVKKFNLQKTRVLLIGDAPADIKAARSAGVKIASVVWDSYAKTLVMESNSSYLFHTVEELHRFIKKNIQ
ncbi:MAG TPA: HAD-IA family hydrolase [Ignavibacteriales bacterium]|nr:HAD-IA family hydrolase [Ignavibacteriales bacterium]